MISSLHRFHGLGSLRFAYKTGRTVRGSWSLFKYTLNTKQAQYRASIVVSKKISKSAVVRNRIRRRVYEALRHHEKDISQPYDIVITILSEKVAELPYNEIEKEVLSALNSAGILTKNSSPR